MTKIMINKMNNDQVEELYAKLIDAQQEKIKREIRDPNNDDTEADEKLIDLKDEVLDYLKTLRMLDRMAEIIGEEFIFHIADGLLCTIFAKTDTSLAKVFDDYHARHNTLPIFVANNDEMLFSKEVINELLKENGTPGEGVFFKELNRFLQEGICEILEEVDPAGTYENFLMFIDEHLNTRITIEDHGETMILIRENLKIEKLIKHLKENQLEVKN